MWAAGNNSIFTPMDPSKRGESTIRVAAVDRNLKPASFTNFGNIPEKGIHETTVSAPGVDILGAMPYGSYDIGPGTSFAAPLVAGAVGLMKSINKNLTNSQIVDILRSTGKPIGKDSRIGPLLQIENALQETRKTI